MSQQGCSLTELEPNDEFIARHIGPNKHDQQKMLEQLGLNNMQALIEQVVPATIYSDESLAIETGCSEQEALAYLKSVASKNKQYQSLIGQGYYNCYTPNVILRNILENPGWYTAYTPYQPEISQGRLEALLNFQTLISDLTGMDLANSSLLDEATAAAEAMTLCQRISKSKSNVFFVSQDCFPQTIEVVKTRAKPIGIDVLVGDHRTDLATLDCFGVLLQYPAASGEIYDYQKAIEQAHAKKALVVMAADLLSLLLLKSPGELGADVAIGSSQRFGVPLGFGGPHAGYMATKEAFKRALPGRIVGLSIDSQGQPAYRLALQTREQHIRREKATSNICTAQVLLAVMASMYAVYHGPQGLTRIAQRVNRLTQILAQGLTRLGYTLSTKTFFDTLVIQTGNSTQAIHEAARAQQINLREIDQRCVGISLDETIKAQDVERLWAIFALDQTVEFNVAEMETDVEASEPGKAGMGRPRSSD